MNGRFSLTAERRGAGEGTCSLFPPEAFAVVLAPALIIGHAGMILIELKCLFHLLRIP